MNRGRAKATLQNLLGTTHVQRVRIIDQDLTDNTNVYLSLLKAQDDDVDYDIVSDGTLIARCDTGARIVDIQLHTVIWGMASSDRVEVIMYRDRDSGITTSMTPAALFTSDYTTVTDAVRKHCMHYNYYQGASNRDAFNTPIRASRGAMARNKQMQDQDILKILFSMNDGSTTRKMTMIGRITTVV